MNRRDFIKTGAVLAAVPALAAGEKRVIRAAVVGCGGRGTGGANMPKNENDFYGQGAMGNLLNAAKICREQGLAVEVKPVAFADYFLDKAKVAAKKFGVDEANAYGGANGYKEIMKRADVDVVILTTPLNFRPVHTMAAVKAGKHVFAEKGVAVDGRGCRLMIEASKLAAEKNLTIVCGTQRRHQRGYLLQKQMLDAGLLGTILGGEVYWNSAVPWVRRREPGMSNADYLCNNWLNFTELSGDHICEQHVHNIDVANWFLGRYPKTCLAVGGRSRRYSGNQYDCFSADFDYGDGVHIHSMCRQVDGCKNDVREFFLTDRKFSIAGGQIVKNAEGKRVDMLPGDFMDYSPYVVEHVDLIKSVLGKGPYYNEGEACAISTACGVMVRLSAYTGQIISLNDLLKNERSPFYGMDCVPRAEDFEQGEVAMPALGDDEWARPGKPWRDLEKYAQEAAQKKA